MYADSGQTARESPDGWLVSFLPDRYFSRNAAVTALNLAELIASGGHGDRTRLRLAESWLDELGLGWEDVRCLHRWRGFVEDNTER